MSRKPFVKDLFWFPKKYVSMSRVKKHFSLTLFEDADEEVILDAYKLKSIGGETWIGLPRGDAKQVKNCLKNPRYFDSLEDRRTDAPVKIALKFLGDHSGKYKYQPKAASKLASSDNGVLKSAPRTGKCLTGDTLVHTSRGILRLDEFEYDPEPFLELGRTEDEMEHWHNVEPIRVASKDGPKKVRCFYHSRADVYRITTSVGHEISATSDERFLVDGEWKYVKDLVNGDTIAVQNDSIWSIEQSNPVEVNEALASLMAYR